MIDRVRVVLLDIEGTIAPIAFVHDVLFPFARQRLAAFLEAHWDSPDIRGARAQVEADAGGAALPRGELVAHLESLMQRDAKTTGLKALQGLIWERGYADGALRSPLFADAAPAIRAWRHGGVDVCIYSSGSVAAQRVFLKHTQDGDLSGLISRFFDTTTGPKQAPESYRRIAAVCQVAPGEMLFVSDVVAELDASAAAGMQTRLSLRPGNAPALPGAHRTIRSLAELAPSVATTNGP
ncbi:MAG: Enolase-phosphatase E1 [Phycisphaerae bacterium]|nr:Enolase-phosphatase E1 [Phycisphaerae bacterium]